MGLYGRLIRRYSGRRWFAWLASRFAPGLDRTVYRLTGGRRLATPDSVPTLLLTTTGRRTGSTNTVPLSFATFDGQHHVVGTNFGQSHQPAWALNLLTDPVARVEFRGDMWVVRAVRIDESARDALWEAFDAIVPAYRSYRERLTRPIHMFRLERV